MIVKLVYRDRKVYEREGMDVDGMKFVEEVPRAAGGSLYLCDVSRET